MISKIPWKNVGDRKKCGSCGDVQQLKHGRGEHQVVEVALVGLDGEGDDAENVADDASQGNHNLD